MPKQTSVKTIAEIAINVNDIDNLTLTIHQFRSLDAQALFFEDPEGNLIELICHHKANP